MKRKDIWKKLFVANILVVYIYAIFSVVSFVLLYPLQQKFESFLSNKMDNMTDKIFK